MFVWWQSCSEISLCLLVKFQDFFRKQSSAFKSRLGVYMLILHSVCCVHLCVLLYEEPSVFHGCLNWFAGKITWDPCLKSRGFFWCVCGGGVELYCHSLWALMCLRRVPVYLSNMPRLLTQSSVTLLLPFTTLGFSSRISLATQIRTGWSLCRQFLFE